MPRVHNFNAGPAALPLPALLRAQEELVDWNGTGMSVMEHSHRGKDYEALHRGTITKLKKLMAVPDTHEVLFLQGGASMLFAILAMNFLSKEGHAGYVVNGTWGEKAIAEAKFYGDAYLAAQPKTPTRAPSDDEIAVREGSAYLHYTSNETIHGVQFHRVPRAHGAPLVCDMSSDILSRPVDVGAHALIYAGAQKNIGPSGLVVVVAEKAFLAKGRKDIPKIFRFSTYVENESLYNTIPTFAVYLVDRVCDWIAEEGGLAGLEAKNAKKAKTLYDALAASPFYTVPVEPGSRSLMNVVFRTPSEDLDAKLVAEAKALGMVGLKGHRSVGGIRASIYNAVPQDSVDALATFVAAFARAHA